MKMTQGARCAVAAASVAGVMALHGEAHAVEVYASVPSGTVVVQGSMGWVPPPRVVVPPPVYVAPAVYVPPPRVIVQPLHTVEPVTVVHVVPRTPPVPDDPGDAPTHPQHAERRDPRSSVFFGAGYGGLTGFAGSAASTWRAHLGLGLGATELGLRAEVANRALDALSATTPGGAWLLSAEVAHRFLEGATVRPVVGASFDRWQFNPEGRDSASAFGMGARAGVEIHYRVNPGAALVFGADAGFHRLLAAVDGVNVSPNVLTFGATLDVRL